MSGTIGQFQIWVSSALDAGDLALHASLVNASTNEVLRQTTIDARPSYTPVVRTLLFPSYAVPEGRRLLLQLQVADSAQRPVTYGLAHAQSDHSNLALNGVPDAGSGPLAFTHQVSSSSFRAALHGQTHARTRLMVAIALTGLTALTHPRVRALNGRLLTGPIGKRLRRQAAIWRRRLARSSRKSHPGTAPAAHVRVLAAPWYIWPASLTPILQYLATNPLHFSVREALLPAAAVLLIVTVAVAVLRLVLKDWHQAATAVTAITAIVFAYGHVDRALGGRLDDHVLFPAAVVFAAVCIWIAVQCRLLVSHIAPFLNVTAITLLLFQIAIYAASESGASMPGPQLRSPSNFEDIGYRPDIYYIILDGYSRHDALGQFDNSNFINELEERGFFVATEATSNYWITIQSLASSLNLTYLHDLGPRAPKSDVDSIALVRDNTLAATLKSLGYTYVHLESGSVVTDRAPQADIVATFTPAGVTISSTDEAVRYSYTRDFRANQHDDIRSNVFLRSLIQATALRPLTGDRFRPGDDSPYEWWAPERALRMFEFLSEPIDTPGSKYVFAHIIKPHLPASFDRHGNMFIGQRAHDGFSDAHDPAVPSAYIGQLIFVNSLVLKTVDRILEKQTEKPIIVIAADHGHNERNKHAILAAFHLPDGGESVLYPSISSVNHFRAILDYYFGTNLGLLEDIVFHHDRDQFDMTMASPSGNAHR